MKKKLIAVSTNKLNFHHLKALKHNRKHLTKDIWSAKIAHSPLLLLLLSSLPVMQKPYSQMSVVAL